MVFQSNWLTGAIILVAIFSNSWVYGIACVVGTLAATLTGMALKADRGLLGDGLFGFNGALLAIGLNAYMSQDFTNGAFPGWRLHLYIVIGAAFTSVIMSALLNFLAPYHVPALTAPFVVTGWLFIFAVSRFGHLDPGPLLHASLPEAFEGAARYSWTTWYQGTGKGIGEIFFQDNWITGFLIVIAILVNSRIGAAMALLGSVVGAGAAMILGADETSIRLGLFGFNPALTAIAVGGFFFVLNLRGFLYTFLGVLVTTWTWAAIAVALSPMGMPTFTSAFVIVTWLMIMAKEGFKAVTAVPPAEATTPEDNLARWRAAAAAG